MWLLLFMISVSVIHKHFQLKLMFDEHIYLIYREININNETVIQIK